MAAWIWFVVAIGASTVAAIEVWAWLRFGVSSLVLIAKGLAAATAMLIVAIPGLLVILVIASVVYGVGDEFVSSSNLASSTSSDKRCHPGYEGACLSPSASDYDCSEGSGDGPRYVEGTVEVTGDDPFDLDRDGDGIACDW